MKLNINITFSKLIASVTLILGFVLSITCKESASFLAAVGVVMVIVTGQNLGNSIINSKCNKNE